MKPSDICQSCGHTRGQHREDTGACCSATHTKTNSLEQWIMCPCIEFVKLPEAA